MHFPLLEMHFSPSLVEKMGDWIIEMYNPIIL